MTLCVCPTVEHAFDVHVPFVSRPQLSSKQLVPLSLSSCQWNRKDFLKQKTCLGFRNLDNIRFVYHLQLVSLLRGEVHVLLELSLLLA